MLGKLRKKLFSTLHEQGAGGINGKLAQLIQNREYDSAITFFESNPAVASAASTASLNYLLEAYFGRGRHLDAILLAKKVDELQLKPNLQTFNYLMKGLVSIDTAGTLALSVDEIFQVMSKRYGLTPDWQSWLFRIQAFLRPKFMTAHGMSESGGAAKVFYEQMLLCQALPTDKAKLHEIQTELLVTAVNRRVWSFAEFMLGEIKTSASQGESFLFPAWEQVCLAKGLFSEIGCVPVLRELQQFSLKLSQENLLASPLSSLSLHKNILIFATRQGRCCADLAFYSLNFLLRHDDPSNAALYSALAARVLSRTIPLDLEFFNAPDGEADNLQASGFLSLVEKFKCSDVYLQKLKTAINPC